MFDLREYLICAPGAKYTVPYGVLEKAKVMHVYAYDAQGCHAKAANTK